MRILAIRIKNLASLEGITEIDFTKEPLSSAGIFSITGPMGAGKSTILDALCLALYAKTPRYKQAESGVDIHDVQGATINQNDVRGILRDGTADGFAEVDFVGVDNHYYRATWSVRRARNKVDGNLQAYDIYLKNISTNTAIPGRKTELLEETERLVGLNFEQFTRSVLLAQGDFTAFLKAGKDEKSALLEKLTGTHVYSEISKRVFEKHREQAQQLRDLNIQREGILTLTNEELDALKIQKGAIEVAVQAQEKLIVDLGKEITWHEQWTTLQSGLEFARLQCEQATTAKEAALPRERQLQQIVRVQSVRPVVDYLNTTQSQFQDKSVSLEQLKAQSGIFQHQKEALDLALQQAEDNLNARIEEQEAAQPLINSAKALEVQLNEKKAQVHQAKAELDTAREKQQRQEEQFAQQKQKAEQLENEVKQLRHWKENNTARQPIAEQHSLIISKLSDAGTLLETQKNRQSLILTSEKKITSNQQDNERLDKEHSALQASLQQAQQDYESQKEVLSDTPIGSLEQEKTNLDVVVEDVIAAEAHWKLLFVAMKERDILQKNLEDNRKELETNFEHQTRTKILLETASIQRDTSLNMLEKARLAAAENVESIRTQLVPDEPCPVCGSTSHPYAEHNSQLNHVLRELEAGHWKIEATYTEYLTTHSRLMQVCDQLNKTISMQETDFPLRAKSVLHLEEIWTGFTIYNACEAQAIDERAAWLRRQLQQEKERQHQLRQQILSYGVKKEQLEKQKNKLDELDKQFTQTYNTLKDTERNLKSLQEQLANHKQEQQKVDTTLENVQQSLSVYFTSEQWFQHWKNEPETFAHQIQEFAGQWKTNAQQLEEGIRQQGILTETLKGLQEQWKNVLEDAEQKEQNLSQIQAQWSDLAGKRKAIFDGKPIATVENGLKESVNQTRQVLDQQKAERETLLANLTRAATQKEQAEKDLFTLMKQEASLKEKIEEWINSHNQQHVVTLSEPELQELLSFTQDWIEAERQALRVIDDAVMQAKSVWTEREHRLDKHLQERLSERTSEELIVFQAEAKVLQQQNNQTFNEIGFRLGDDATNKQHIGTLLQTIEAQSLIVDNWAKLNEIIGSADGKKFRQVAQEYTLDVLLSYANVHLEVLSKRYVLQRIPRSLGLQVLDQDMGNEIRTIYSLSGGESFLVSLALALGLASLSSSRMKVESLFIDEGFGSLDPTTLNIAMDALERLHNQGRKVGVISHVQEMTERIPVQIKVSKQHSGKSKVEVYG